MMLNLNKDSIVIFVACLSPKEFIIAPNVFSICIIIKLGKLIVLDLIIENISFEYCNENNFNLENL